MQLYIFVLPIIIYLSYNYFSTMFLSLLGICMLIYFFFYLICLVLLDCDVSLGFAERFGKSISSLKGKVVFITGASSGIGEYTALALAKNGVKLVLAARRQEELNRVKSQCLAVSNGQLENQDILVLPMDVLRYDLHQKYFDDALHHFGCIDILVNNAGRSQRANWENIDLSVDREMFDLNVFGVVNFTRIAVRYFLEKKRVGHVAVTSSIAGIVGVPFSASYNGSKHAIHGYFNGLRSEKIMENISVTIFCPGPIFTNFLQHCFTEQKGETYQQSHTPTDKRMSAERCGHLCAVALANKLNESWMALFPIILVTYICAYCPGLYKLMLKIIGPKKFLKLRDNREDLQLPTANH